MTQRRIKRNAWNRGTAVHLGGARVRFCWACGCKHVQTIKSPKGPLSEGMTAQLVRNWRNNGVVLEQCKLHPDFHTRTSNLAQLNADNPPET